MVESELIRIKRVKKIPEEMVTEFIQEGIGINSSYYHKVKTNPIKIGAFKGKTMIGFMVAKIWRGDLWIDAPFVKKQYQGEGTGSKMLFRMFGEAKKRGIEHVGISNTTLKFDIMSSRAMTTLKKKGITTIKGRWWDEDLKAYWDYYVKKKKEREKLLKMKRKKQQKVAKKPVKKKPKHR